MRKTYKFALAVFMAVALVACGSSSSSSSSSAASSVAASSVETASSSQVVVASSESAESAEPADSASVTAASAAADSDANISPFAGEYDLYSEEKDMYCEEFIIDEDGTVHGVVESSGLTSFEGTVSEDGTITAEFPRLGGTMTGTITEDLQVSAHMEVRGSVSDFEGGPL